MLRLLTTLSFAFFYLTANAQIEVKVNPLGLLFGSPDLSAEYIVNDRFGVELTLNGHFGKVNGLTVEDEFDPKKSGFGAMASGKYYFSPKNGADKFYMGVYLRQNSYKVEDRDNSDYVGFKRSIFAGGINSGYKWAFSNNVLIELGIGIGKAFSEKNEWLSDNDSEDFGIKIGIDFVGKLAIGYRF